MYWIYLAIFALTVFVPSFIRQGFMGFSLVQTQEYAILILGICAYALFIVQDSLLAKLKRQKNTTQNHSKKVENYLQQTYSYIGQVNRKIDILKEIVSECPNDIKINNKTLRNICKKTLKSVRALTKSEAITIRIIGENGGILFESHLGKKIDLAVDPHRYQNARKYFEEADGGVIVVCTPYNGIEEVAACILMLKSPEYNPKIADPELLKALASHALFLYVLWKRKLRGVD